LYLLDTNVISELRRPRPHGAVVAWVKEAADEDLHLSAVTLGELQAGVEITREQDPEKAAEIEAWIDQVAQTWNVLPADGRIFRSWLPRSIPSRRSLEVASGSEPAAPPQRDLRELTTSARLRRLLKGQDRRLAWASLLPDTSVRDLTAHLQGGPSLRPISSTISALTSTRMPWRSREVKWRRFSVATSRAPACRAISAMCAS
jgi:PIN domain-containing protein